jgi:HlyD family secretion protein
MTQILLAEHTPVITTDPELRLAKVMRRSKLAITLLTLGFGSALALIPISGAVITRGEVTVASGIKTIAHPLGGVVAAILVSDGDRVSKGQLLLRLDTNVSSASAKMTTQSIDQLLGREARLRAERDGSRDISFPDILTSRSSNEEVAHVMRDERRVLALGRQSIESQRAAIAQQIKQSEYSIRGYKTQADVYRNQELLIAEEKSANDQLWEKGFTTLQRRNELHRAAEGLRGNVASAETSGAQVRSRIAELQERSYSLEDNARRLAGESLVEVQSKLIELRQNNVVTQDTNNRNLVRAPYAGIVDKSAFTTVGGVIPAGKTIMEIVPDEDALIVTARVDPKDVDKLRNSNNVMLRFTAFDMQTTPQINGKLTKISADRTTDPQHGIAYYPVVVTIASKELAKLGPLKLRPGMPVEAFFETGDRTLLAYLLKPLSDQIARAFR